MNVFLQLYTCALLGASHLCSQSSKDSFMERKDKTMKNMKKFSAIVLAIVMVLMYAVPMSVMAAPGDATTDATISVTDLTAGDAVKAYKVLEWVDGSGWALTNDFKGLIKADGTGLGTTEKAVVDAIIAGVTQEQANKISALASSATALVPAGETVAEGETEWSKSNPEAGLYMVIVAAKDAGVVYNPAFVGADFKANDSNTVSITAKYSNSSVAKKETITVSKTTTDANEEKQEAINSYVGQEVTFYVNTTIPVFLDSYQNPSFIIKDAIKTQGISLNADSIKVKLGATGSQTVYGKTAAEGVTAYDTSKFSVSPATATGYTVTFDPTYLGGLATAVPVEIEYTGTITNAAEFNVNEDNNTVDVEYSNGPGEEKAVLRDRTNHYTFSIGAKAFGQTSADGKTYELVKVAVDAEGKPVVEKKKISEWKDEPERHPLAGAKFGLYTDAKCAETARYKYGKYSDTTAYPDGAEFTTGADGIINFEGLAAGTYYIKELDAPNGYVKDTNIVQVDIVASYKNVTVADTVEEGVTVKGYTTQVLDKYTVTVNNVDVYTAGEEGADGSYGASSAAVVSTYEFDNNGPTISQINESTNVKDGDIPNTVGQELPSTGGIGTTIFYILGAILVLGAGVLLVTRRRMRASEE